MDGRPLITSRTSIRNPRCGSLVLKSSPPPNWVAHCVSLPPPEKWPKPAPPLTNGEIEADGANCTRNEGVKKKLEKVGLKITEVRERDGLASTGSSTKSAAALKLAIRWAKLALNANAGGISMVPLGGQVMISQIGVPFGETVNVPPKVTPTSFFCAVAAVKENKTKASRANVGFTKDPFLRRRNHIDLNSHILGQACYLHRRTRGWRILAHFSVHFVHLPEF